MQFTILTLVSLIAVALASPIAMPAPEAAEIDARAPVAGDSAPVMSNSAGDVVPFSSTSVTLPLLDAGQ